MTEQRTWTRARPESVNRPEWFAAEPCPDCDKHTIIVVCGTCHRAEYWTGMYTEHTCEERAECYECGWMEED